MSGASEGEEEEEGEGTHVFLELRRASSSTRQPALVEHASNEKERTGSTHHAVQLAHPAKVAPHALVDAAVALDVRPEADKARARVDVVEPAGADPGPGEVCARASEREGSVPEGEGGEGERGRGRTVLQEERHVGVARRSVTPFGPEESQVGRRWGVEPAQDVVQVRAACARSGLESASPPSCSPVHLEKEEERETHLPARRSPAAPPRPRPRSPPAPSSSPPLPLPPPLPRPCHTRSPSS